VAVAFLAVVERAPVLEMDVTHLCLRALVSDASEPIKLGGARA